MRNMTIRCPMRREDHAAGGYIARVPLTIEACDRNRSDDAAQVKRYLHVANIEGQMAQGRRHDQTPIAREMCLHLRLDGATLVPAMKRPFGVLAEGPSCLDTVGATGDAHFLTALSGMRLFHAAIAVARPFTAEDLEALGRGQATLRDSYQTVRPIPGPSLPAS